MNNNQRYKLSFTAIALGLTESIKVAEIYLNCHDWQMTKEIIDRENVLQSRTHTRSIRTVQEIVLRLSQLTDHQLELLVEGSLEEQRLLLWFTVCNYYLIIREFAIEVLHERFLVMDRNLAEKDYQTFYLNKLDWHPELEKITESTQIKLRTVLFRMMREAGLLTDQNDIIRVIPSIRLSQALRSHADFAYQIYPAFPDEFEV